MASASWAGADHHAHARAVPDLALVDHAHALGTARHDDGGDVHLLGKPFPVGDHWLHRFVRCEVDFTYRQICFYAPRGRNPDCQPLLLKLPYHHPHQPAPSKIMSVRLTLKLCHVDVKNCSDDVETCPVVP